ncbi:3-hydroxyacyl-CoA dehydrogenase PaaH [Pseudomonas antarctica]|uniref:3-hydroxyacyl-CoA dehydrogenase PaaH n=1 Tax=Pseudomonas antarctica TaxID=219572 RepID=UPI00345D5F4E
MAALDKNTLVAVIGAGAMGSGIAQVALQAGHPVALFDNRANAAEQAVQGLALQLGRLVEKGRMTESSLDDCLSRLHAIESLGQLAHAGLVIEAIVENIDVKRTVFQDLEDICQPTCILASNTSSLSITALAAGLKQPERVVGMHFFNPAPLMALVEVISGLATDEGVADCVYQTAIAWRKKPVHARSTPGFIVNRVARPFYAESFRLLQEQASDPATLDALMRDAGGFRMGAFELTDLIGHDVNYAVTCSVFDAYYSDTRFQPSLIQKELVDAGRFGRKSGQGFFEYHEGAVKPEPKVLSAKLGFDRCVVEGDLGVAHGLLARMGQSGIEVVQRGGLGLLRMGEAVMAMSDGRMASQRAREDGLQNLVLFDLAHDFTRTNRLAITWASNTSDQARIDAVSLLAQIGIQASALADVPGLAVLRTVAMLVNEGAEVVLHGVSSAADVDLAMEAGVNYPIGPLAWADTLGPKTILDCLEHLQASYGEERYRPSLLLRRITQEGRRFHD